SPRPRHAALPVAPDQGIGRRCRADTAQGLMLDLENLRHSLLDDVGIGCGILDGGRGPHALSDDLPRPGREETVAFELLRLLHDPLMTAGRLLRGHVREHDVPAGERYDLGDAAAHVPRADHGDAFTHACSLFSLWSSPSKPILHLIMNHVSCT